VTEVKKDNPVMRDVIDSPYAKIASLKYNIFNKGL